MHVGAVIAGFDPQSGGGHTFEQEVLWALKDAASSSAHRFTVLAPSAAGEPLKQALSGSLGVADVPQRTGRIRSMLFREIEAVRAHWRRPSDLDRVARAEKIDFIWFLSAHQQRTDLPYMTVVWDLQHRATPWFPEMSAGGVWDSREASHRWFLQRATKIVTGTDVGREQLKQFFQIPAENVLILPHPTPSYALAAAPFESASAVARLGLKQPFVLYPAQFWPHKNHANLLLAISELKRRGREIHLALVGSDTGNRQFVADLAAREGISELVRFLGFVSREDLVALYREALALTYVSWCGPENMPPLEAFALGCPVIASQIPGANEQLGDAALMCEPGDPKGISEAVERLTSDGALRGRLAAAGLARAKRFTPSDYVAGAIGFLDQFAAIRRCWP
ncbi:glycosyltransferase family 4 protein [Bradyrhizobium erythrophlei]|uniref:Glycosyltransferase involved in cell wall bisynthesis n=1 Tax=Bradyrhizobium erythrophlei TaxID=1437360 RepID=A0A1M7UHU8_9BRAD|nr:glycosyltransferase family 1 protein [Bradyrhizobium erythrophlei]SHN82447.1 Glycosyltransferase involved in cell wall bisynthesis [Bradyrhizobium erythrophlei]